MGDSDEEYERRRRDKFRPERREYADRRGERREGWDERYRYVTPQELVHGCLQARL